MKQRVNRMLWKVWAVVSGMIVADSLTTDAAIHLSPMTPVSPPALTTNLMGRRTTPVVAAGRQNALLTYLETSAFGGPTNVMAVAISPDGKMITPFAHLVGGEGFAGSRPEIYPAGDEFYFVFRQRLSLAFNAPGTIEFSRVGADGSVLIAPQTIATNGVYQFVSGSDGQSLLGAWLDLYGVTYFALFNRDGSVVHTKVSTIADPFAPTKLSSAGRTYLVVEQDRSGRLESIAVDGYTGVTFTNRFTTAPGFRPMALSSDGSQYLLATETTAFSGVYSNQFYLLSGDGRVLSTGGATNLPRFNEPKMFPYAGGWVVWGNQSFSQLGAYSVSVAGASIVVSASPLPSITGQWIAPFDEEFLVATQVGFTNVGYKIVTASGESAVQSPLEVAQQTLTSVASSPSGYLVMWQERGDRTNVLGARFQKDGTRLDATPFIIVSNAITGPIRAAFETNAYHVVWPGSIVGILIDVDGPPNPRPSARLSIRSGADLELTTFDGGLVAYQRTQGNTLVVTAEGVTNIFGAANLAGSEDRVFEAIVSSRQLRAGLAPGPLALAATGKVIGVTTNPVAVAKIGTNFFMAWRDLRSSNIIAAVTADGTVTKTNVLFTNTPATTMFTAAGTDNHALLCVAFTKDDGAGTNLLALYDAKTASYSFATQPLRPATNGVSIASLGEDFVLATTLWGEAGPYAAVQLVTATTPAQLRISAAGGILAVDFTNLEPTRTYLIQRSTDLVTWETVETVKQLETWPFSAPIFGGSAFYRAILQPQ